MQPAVRRDGWELGHLAEREAAAAPLDTPQKERKKRVCFARGVHIRTPSLPPLPSNTKPRKGRPTCACLTDPQHA